MDAVLDNVATGNVTSGTASEALVKAATAASSADATPVSDKTGDTSAPAGAGTSGAIPDATGQPAPTGSVDATTTRGAIPFDRHEAAVRNARDKARTEVEQTYAWAKDFKPADVADMRVALDILRTLRADASAFHAQLGSELGVGSGHEEEEVFPQPDLISADGKLKTYSDASIAKMLEIQGNKIKREMMGIVKPLQDWHTSTAEQRVKAEGEAQAKTVAGQVLAETRKLPHFTKENEPLILEKFKAISAETVNRIGPIAALYQAYNAFLSENVFPSIETAAETRVRDSFARKAATSRGQAHPTNQGGESNQPEIRNVTDLARHMERLASSS